MHPDLPQEQAYFDRALALRDRQQADLARAPGMAANPRAAVELRKRVSRLGLADPDEAIAFGRIDAADDRWYIGKGAIWGDDNDLVVVNWQAPIAAPFYTATPDEPEGLDSRRLYRCSGNQIREIEDLMFREVARAIAEGEAPEPVLSDALLDSLGSSRSGELGDIVATIQASQYEVISRPLDQLLVVQGGPGTGKTVVGLHRVSWLLFNRRDRLEARDVLIVGPNPAFVHYISSVLPSLGDEAVVQLPLRALGPSVRIGRVDPPALRRLKGDRRLLRLVLRGLRNRQRVEASAVEIVVDGRRLELDGRRIATRARQLAGRPHNEAYRMLRAFLVAEATAALGRTGVTDVSVQGPAARDIDNYLDRVWPNLTPQAFLVELLSSRRQLLAAGAGTLSEAELDLLALPTDARVSTWQWSADDVPLLDAADALLNGVRATYEHIVVDEAQDLSPLQLESIRRRSRAGSMTVLGDLAQGTSPWAHHSWDAIVQVLRHERVAAEAVELTYGYRLPAEVHEVAMRLLPEAAPGLSHPRALRSSGHEVVVTAAAGDGHDDDVVARTVEAIVDAAGEGIVGVITAPPLRSRLVSGLDAAGVAWASELRPAAAPVVVLTPDEAKGLEFDVVIVVEPAAVVEGTEHGLRSLFVALTRCTTRLVIVHARPLPPVLDLGSGDVQDVEAALADAPGGTDRPEQPVLDPTEEIEAVDAPAADDPLDGRVAPFAAAVTPPDVDVDESGVLLYPADEDDIGSSAARADRDDHGDLEARPRPTPAVVEPAALAQGEPVDAPPSSPAPPADPADATATPPAPPADPVDGTATPPARPADPADAIATSPAAAVTPPDDPADRVAATVALLGDLDHDVARAVAHAVADKLALLVAPALLPLVTEELVRTLDERTAGVIPVGEAATDSGAAAGGEAAAAEHPPSGVPTS
ncbi:MAG TPA: UvrD-helicase domain-containing protein [Acidimicrobiales bacterium]|nr:UvrD-helicase domain-containing protein [Acidimicrobiales bacterium]